jgi:DNA-binding winged helix-turn-helix (wHTH) protein
VASTLSYHSSGNAERECDCRRRRRAPGATGGDRVHLAPKAFELLLLLVRSQPNAVSHEQLHAALWPGVHVSETSLAALVTQLRKALGDTSGDGRVIRTLHRVGYAFIGDAVVAGDTPVTGAPVCRLIWRRESIEVPAGESVIGATAAARFKSMRTRSRATTLG